MPAVNAAGGPAGAGPIGNPAAARQQADNGDQKRLNTYIYDYFLKNEQYDLARTFCKTFEILKRDPTKPSPGRANGVDDSMDMDSKEDVKKPVDLPEPMIPPLEGSFLFDWWCQFWDIYGARTQLGPKNPTTQEFIQHNINQRTNRQAMQQRMLSGGDPAMMQRMQGYNMQMGVQTNGMMNAEVAKRTLANTRPGNPAQMAQMQQTQKMLQQNQMQREGSQMDMSGQGRGSPSAGNAPSPSKRPRLDDGNAFGGQPGGPAGRGHPMSGPQMNGMNAAAGPNGPGGMLLQNGMNPEMQQQMAAFSGAPNMQQKQLEAMNAAGMPQPNQMGADGNMDFARGMAAGAAGQAGGNHALQDYQMQLMLLEQQNKKRLLMARQEQENSNHPGQAGATGTTEHIEDAGPYLHLSDMQNRGSPAPGANFDPNGMPANMPPQYYAQMGGNMMNRPPSSHPGFTMQQMQNMNPQQLEAMRRSGMLPNGGQWPQGGPQQQQMMAQQQAQGPGQPPGQPQQPAQVQMGTPQQRAGTMPPPPAPASQEQQQRTQPSSPAPSNQAPPTPSQPPKANPKGKKEAAAKPTKKNPPKKTGNTGQTPAADNAEPPTPTPSTPITPMHPKSFNQPNGTAPVSQPANAQPTPVVAAPPAVPDPSMGLDTNGGEPFGLFGNDGGNPSDFNLDFNIDNPNDVLDNFDFDALLNEGGGFNFDGVELSGDAV